MRYIILGGSQSVRFTRTFGTNTLSQRMLNIDSINEDVLASVYKEFTRKICNTRIQEFVSSTKQQFATKKGVASTVEVNLRSTLLAHHTKLECKLGKN